MPPNDSAYQELHLNTATSNLIAYQILGIAKNPSRNPNQSFMYDSVSSNTCPSPFCPPQEKRETLHLPQKYLWKYFWDLEVISFKNTKMKTTSRCSPYHFEKIFTILLISSSEFAEAYLEVRSHHPFLPASDLSFGSSLKTQGFFQPSSLSTGTCLVLSCTASEAMEMTGYL